MLLGRSGILSLLAFGAIAAASPVGWAPASIAWQGPGTTRIPDEISCRACEITFETARVISGGDKWVFPPASVRLDARRGYWILPGFEPPLVYDSAGRYLTQVGRKGTGPGEYWSPVDVVMLPGDSALLIDASGFGAVIGPDLREVRRVRMPGVLRPSVVLNWPHLVLMAGSLQGPSTIGLDLHHVSLVGATAHVLKSFALDDGEYRPGMTSNYVLAGTPSGDVWAGNRSRYRFAKWTVSGHAGRIFEREPSWFRGQGASGAGSPTEPPPPVLTGLAADARGRLWTLSAVPAPTWREAWANTPLGAREVAVAQIAWEKLYEGIVEVIDPVLGRVIARQRIREFVLGFLPSGHLLTYRVDKNGEANVVINVLRLSGEKSLP